MKIIAVVPAFNESKMIASIVRDLKNEVDRVVVVDDGSTDNTGKLAKSEGAVVLQHFLNRGQGAALQTGIDFALQLGADIIITFDADGQHDVADIKKLAEPLMLDGVDIVLGSRFISSSKLKMPFLRLVILKLAVAFDRLRTGLKITDTHNGLRAISRRAAGLIKIRQDGMAHASEILEQISQLGLKYKEVPVTIKYTDYSRQKGQRLSGTFRILWDLLLGRISK
jgi:glycosyltransferase involved in cell wall biosynthesis